MQSKSPLGSITLSPEDLGFSSTSPGREKTPAFPLLVCSKGQRFQPLLLEELTPKQINALRSKRYLNCFVLETKEANWAENCLNPNIPPFERAEALVNLQTKLGCTQERLGVLLNRSRDFVTTLLATQKIHGKARQLLEAHPEAKSLTLRHLRNLGRTPPRRQAALLKRILREKLSATKMEQEKREQINHLALRLHSLRETTPPKPEDAPKMWRSYERRLLTDLRRIEKQREVRLKKLREKKQFLVVQIAALKEEAQKQTKLRQEKLKLVKAKLKLQKKKQP